MYNGKELNEDYGANLYEYGARWYDPALGRWTSIDPLAETMTFTSPYSYGFNNPIAYSDPTGMLPYKYNWDEGRYEDEEGNEVSWGTVKNYIDENNGASNDMAILVAFPEDSPRMPSNQKIGKWLEKTFVDGDGNVQGAGHAGIVIVDGETGYLRYFDFGRYNRTGLTSSRGENEGSVRSSANFSGLRLNFNWDFNQSDDENVTKILTALHGSPLLRRYGMIVGALAKDLDYDAMLSYAQEMENLGYLPFGGYTTSCGIGNSTYCAKFARGVAGAGGMSFAPGTFTGLANVKAASSRSGSNIISIP